MTHGKENRLSKHEYSDNLSLVTRVATYTYDGDGLKRSEVVNDGSGTVSTTLVWDGDDYLQGRT